MAHLFLISDNAALRNSLQRFLRSRIGFEIWPIAAPTPPPDLPTEDKLIWVANTFRKITNMVEREEQTSVGGLLNAIAVIDVPSLRSWADLNPIDRTQDWPAVVGMLILAFPEMHWVIVGSHLPELIDNQPPFLSRLHLLDNSTVCEQLDLVLRFHVQGFTPLFDPSSLRSNIRRAFQTEGEADYVPVRSLSAVSIDDEESYTYLHGYAAYRFGFRSHIVTSYSMMNETLVDGAAEDFSVSFEDIYLNFADRPHSLSRIQDRDERFQALLRIPHRIFVTSGHSRTVVERETADANERYLCHRACRRGLHTKTLYKPESGIFDVWTRSGLYERMSGIGGRAAGFRWPPPSIDRGSRTAGTHSSPGRLLMIAERLIHRARRIQQNAASVMQAVYGATLALDAQEYLGHRTPTTSLDAVALKHHCEVLAECMFFGVEYNLNTERRFDEIEEEMDDIGIWFKEETREPSKLNAEIGIVSDLVLTFRSYNQFNEEQAALTKLRHLHRRLWVKRNEPWSWFGWIFRWYVDHLLGSIKLFIGALVAWILIFGAIFSVSDPLAKERGKEEHLLVHGMEDAIATFFGMQPPHDLLKMEAAGEGMVWLTLFIILMGFVHLGIFVSHLYSIMSRR